MFEVIPAIDIKNGKCVRLYQGKANRETVYFEDPVEVAKKWEHQGAKRIHVVDLDGAFMGFPRNIGIVGKIVESVGIPIEFGGGVRTIESIEELFGLGIDRVIVGTIAVSKPKLFKKMVEEFPRRIVLGIDAKNGFVTTKGWIETTEVPAVKLAESYDSSNIWGFIYTDISRDGTLSSPNFKEIERFTESVRKPIIASGGVSCNADIERLKQMSCRLKNLKGVIVGKALYEGRVKLV